VVWDTGGFNKISFDSIMVVLLSGGSTGIVASGQSISRHYGDL